MAGVLQLKPAALKHILCQLVSGRAHVLQSSSANSLSTRLNSALGGPHSTQLPTSESLEALDDAQVLGALLLTWEKRAGSWRRTDTACFLRTLKVRVRDKRSFSLSLLLIK